MAFWEIYYDAGTFLFSTRKALPVGDIADYELTEFSATKYVDEFHYFVE